jgi:hypothetical protein
VYFVPGELRGFGKIPAEEIIRALNGHFDFPFAGLIKQFRLLRLRPE